MFQNSRGLRERPGPDDLGVARREEVRPHHELAAEEVPVAHPVVGADDGALDVLRRRERALVADRLLRLEVEEAVAGAEHEGERQEEGGAEPGGRGHGYGRGGGTDGADGAGPG